jgi:hypothetical protein
MAIARFSATEGLSKGAKHPILIFRRTDDATKSLKFQWKRASNDGLNFDPIVSEEEEQPAALPPLIPVRIRERPQVETQQPAAENRLKRPRRQAAKQALEDRQFYKEDTTSSFD